MFFLIVVEIVGLLFPLILQSVVVAISNDASTAELFGRSGLVLGFIVLIFIVNLIATYFISIYANKYAQNVRREVFNKFQRVSTETIENFGKGKVVPAVLNDPSWIAVYQRRFIVAAIVVPGTVFGSMFMMFQANVMYSLIALAAVPIIALFYFINIRKMNKVIPPSVEAFDEYFENIKEGITGAKDIRILGKAEERSRKFEKVVDLQRRQSMNADMRNNFSASFNSILFTIITVGIIIYGVNTGNTETMYQLAVLNTVLMYIARIQWASHQVFVWFVEHMPRIWVTKKRLQEVYRLPEVPNQGGLTYITKPAEPTLSLSNLEFIWPNGSRGINLSLDIPYNTRIAIAGGVGSGKSILPKLLLRMEEPSGGCINLNGIDISSINQEYLRREILGYCGPNSRFINGTIRDNMKILSPSVSDEEILSIFNALGADDFIKKFGDNFLDYQLNINKKLSDGTRNILGIARCALKPASIHIFNQCFDHVKQEYIINLMEYLKQNSKTCLFISYDPWVCRNSNEVYVLKNGKITGQGKHAELLRENADYKRFYQSTSGTIPQDDVADDLTYVQEVIDEVVGERESFDGITRTPSGGEVVI
ncbi:MAG: ABC transporter ATP-binding protein/permease [Firmicutes bacterium]|nr:ABC transporter ATP-binding protein/permease [Bacillota bacterium]